VKYKVNFSGFAYVEADNPQEAEELFLNDETVYMETEIVSTGEVDDFSIRL
jgi:hypothetical protein